MSTTATFTCPRCLFTAPLDAGVRFCPRCGLAEVSASDEGQTMNLTVAGQNITVRDRLAFGEICNLYRCTNQNTRREGVLKIARTHQANRHVAHEAETLGRLREADRDGRASPFLPQLVGSVSYTQTNGEPARLASVLTYHEGISGPDDLYTLEQVRTAHPNGIDARDMAWMWRRLLTALGFLHVSRLVHGTVTPDHVLIEPREHKLVLIGWCGAVLFGSAPLLMPERWRGWGSWEEGASPKTDLAGASRAMTYLLNSNVEPAITRHLERAADSSSGASKLLTDFDRMIDALWGPRHFRPFPMPPHRT